MILGIAVVAAVATPTPDPVTMLLAMGPLVVLFELSVALARVFEKRRLLDDAERRWDVEDDDATPYPERTCCSTSAAAAGAARSR